MSDQIFISYRREDTADVTGRIYDRLIQKFGVSSVFKDVDSMPLGTDFRKHLESVITRCSIVLVIIGDDWMAKDARTGATRLDNPRDFVRVEIESALQRGIPVIPLLVEGASMPPVESLPEGLREFAYRHGTEIGRDPNFHPHMNRLIKELEDIFERRACDERQEDAPRQSSQPPTPRDVPPAPPPRRTSAPLPPFLAAHTSSTGQASAGELQSQPSSGWKKLLLVFGGLAVLSAVGLVLFLVLVFNQAAVNVNSVGTNVNGAINVNSARTVVATDAPRPAGGTRTYSNRDSTFEGLLKQRFVDFSFDFPSSWQFDTEAGVGASPYFVRLKRQTGDGAEALVLEDFGVSWYMSTGSLAGDRPYFPQVVAWLNGEYKKYFPNYEKVSEGETKIGPYTGYELRFKYLFPDASGSDVQVWGRAVLLPNPPHRTGVSLIMIATPHAPEITGTDDVGLKGETPTILNSFRIGR